MGLDCVGLPPPRAGLGGCWLGLRLCIEIWGAWVSDMYGTVGFVVFWKFEGG